MHLTTSGTQHMAMNEFVDAFADAAPGEAVVYAVGFVAWAKDFGDSPSTTHELVGVCERALRYQRDGLAHLTQKKRDEFVFEYRATKTNRGLT